MVHSDAKFSVKPSKSTKHTNLGMQFKSAVRVADQAGLDGLTSNRAEMMTTTGSVPCIQDGTTI